MQRRSRGAALAAAVLVLAAMGAGGALAQGIGQDFVAPLNLPSHVEQPGEAAPAIRDAVPRPGAPTIPEVDSPSRTGVERVFTMTVARIKSRIYNPDSRRFDRVELRGYRGDNFNPDAPFVAPTINVWPGETVRMNLRNRLPVEGEETCPTHEHDVNKPHCFNDTNLHTHGLWISPSGNSDNVLLRIRPDADFQYEWNIPADHPAGTFWYHPHMHGSTALQVSSGMAGALIVRGDRPPTLRRPGDLDTLLAGTTERIVLFQQNSYGCLDAQGLIKAKRREDNFIDNNGGPTKPVEWVCDRGEVGTLDYFDTPGGDQQIGVQAWVDSGRHTMINGQIMPTFRGTAGEVERWRMIHAGIRDSVNVQIRRKAPNAPALDDPRVIARTIDPVGSYCTGEPIPFYLASTDGLTSQVARPVTNAVFQPAYRFDVLTVLPQGEFCLVDADIAKGASINNVGHRRGLLGLIQVGPPKAGASPLELLSNPRNETNAIKQAMAQRLKELALKNFTDKAVAEKIAGEVGNNPNRINLSSFAPHSRIRDDELTGKQSLFFNIAFVDAEKDASGKIIKPGKDIYQVGKEPTKESLQPYDPGVIHRDLPLGGVEEWDLRSLFIGHPFHIHVNPFQIVAVYNPQGDDISIPGAVDTDGDNQYAGLKGTWKDTIWVKSRIDPSNYGDESAAGTVADKPYRVIIRTRYSRYVGDFVMHCHILDHEDQGMMENIRISPADLKGRVVLGHGKVAGRR